MNLSELIGKKVADIKDKIGSYDSNNELQTSDGIIKLESGECFEIPYQNSETLSLIKDDSYGYTSIFNEEGFFKRLFSKVSYDQEIALRNKKAMRGKAIVGILQFEKAKDEDAYNELEDKMIIELESGYLISEIDMAPFGTGATGLSIFTSKKKLEEQCEQKLVKKY